MSSPAKRRKVDSSASIASRPARTLDHFFGRPAAHDVPGSPAAEGHAAGGTHQPTAENVMRYDATGVISPRNLSDEQLARQLQAEFDREQNQQEPNPELHGVTDHAGGQDNTDSSRRPLPRNRIVDDLAGPGPQTLSLQAATASEDQITATVDFDQSPLTFDPQAYIPALKAQWRCESGGKATYALLVRCFVLISTTQSRIKIVDSLVNCLRVIIESDPQSLVPMVWLTTNSISPSYIDLELGLGGSSISKALRVVCGLDNAGLKTLYNKHGDAGDVAFEAKKKQSLTLRKPKPLTVVGVFESLVKIAKCKGQGSQEAKQQVVEKLIKDSRGAEESRFIVRTLVQHLRIGAVKTTMLIALSRAFLLSRPAGANFTIKDREALRKLKKEQLAEVWNKGEEIVKACFARRPNYNDLVAALLEVGVCQELLLVCGLSIHVPLRPMLGNITRDLSDMLIKLQDRDFSCEFKYDGQRAQVHCDKQGKVSIFSRHLELMTEKYPDLVALVPHIAGDGVSSFILEGEVVAIDHSNGELKTFQTLTNRAKKDVDIGSVKIGVCLFAFDLMFLNGEPLLDRSLRERRELLRSLFIEIPNKFTWVKSLDASSNDSDAVLDFFKQATDTKCEGIMVKVLDNLPNAPIGGAQVSKIAEDASCDQEDPTEAKFQTHQALSALGPAPGASDKQGARRKALLATYEPDKRVDSWLKVKKDYATSSDTLDLVPVGAWHGQGRKAAWWSPILLAVRNPESGCLEAVTKCISGFTDSFYKANKEKYAEGGENTLPTKPSWIEYAGEPDVWFEPQEVWEIAYADITMSPTYTAAVGLVSEERGLSTRFPRFLKIRNDKGIEDATTSDYLATLWRNQEFRASKEGHQVDNSTDIGVE